MGTWIELYCENAPRLSASGSVGEGRCWSLDNDRDVPGVLTHDDHQQRLLALEVLDERASNEGWCRTATGWICPHCIRCLN
jgi:hypothetical protein